MVAALRALPKTTIATAATGIYEPPDTTALLADQTPPAKVKDLDSDGFQPVCEPLLSSEELVKRVRHKYTSCSEISEPRRTSPCRTRRYRTIACLKSHITRGRACDSKVDDSSFRWQSPLAHQTTIHEIKSQMYSESLIHDCYVDPASICNYCLY